MIKGDRNIKTVFKNARGQSTIEYVLLVGAILAIILFFMRPTGVMRNAVNSVLESHRTEMNTLAGRLGNALNE